MMSLALHLQSAEVYDRIQYEPGPPPWERHIEDDDADIEPPDDYRPVSAWVAVQPIPPEDSAHWYDGPCWLWARGLSVDEEAIREREKAERAEREAREKAVELRRVERRLVILLGSACVPKGATCAADVVLDLRALSTGDLSDLLASVGEKKGGTKRDKALRLYQWAARPETDGEPAGKQHRIDCTCRDCGGSSLGRIE